jgi:hypothetical protein
MYYDFSLLKEEVNILKNNGTSIYNKIDIDNSTIKDITQLSASFFNSDVKDFTLIKLRDSINEKYLNQRVKYNHRDSPILQDNQEAYISKGILSVKIDGGFLQNL